MNNVYVTGGSGLVGTAFKNFNSNKLNWNIIPGPHHGGPNFLDRDQTFKFFSNKNIDAIVHTAARVGGIKANVNNPLDFYSENIRINTNVLDAAAHFKIEKCISFLSTCVYPDNASYPLKESSVHSGKPHNSNFAYAYAKRMLDIHSLAINKQLGFQYYCVSPNNLYGINDNFHLEDSHVIPAIIRKFHTAHLNNKDEINLWGSGSTFREFTYANDIPDIIEFLLTREHPIEGIINIGNCSEEIPIANVANLIKRHFGYNINIKWDRLSLAGQLRKPSSNEKLKVLGYNVNGLTKFRHGLKSTIDWFLDNYPNIRGY